MPGQHQPATTARTASVRKQALALGLAAAGLLTPAYASRLHLPSQEGGRPAPASSLRPVPRPGYLGVSLRDMDAGEVMRLHLHGALVATVDRDAPAWAAGLRPHDVIVAIDGQAVDGVESLSRRLRDYPVGETITLHVWHASTVTTVPVTLGDQDQIAKSAMSRHIRSYTGSLAPAESTPGNGFADPGIAANPSVAPGTTTTTPASHGVASSLLDAITPTALYSGLTTDPLTPQLAVFFGVHDIGGLLVTQVRDHSPAAAAGLTAGDVLLRADNRPLHARGDLDHAFRAGKGAPVMLTVFRDRHTIAINLTPDKRKKL